MTAIEFDLPYKYVSYITGKQINSPLVRERIAYFCKGIEEQYGPGKWVGYGTGAVYTVGVSDPDFQAKLEGDVHTAAELYTTAEEVPQQEAAEADAGEDS